MNPQGLVASPVSLRIEPLSLTGQLGNGILIPLSHKPSQPSLSPLQISVFKSGTTAYTFLVIQPQHELSRDTSLGDSFPSLAQLTILDVRRTVHPNEPGFES